MFAFVDSEANALCDPSLQSVWRALLLRHRILIDLSPTNRRKVMKGTETGEGLKPPYYLLLSSSADYPSNPRKHPKDRTIELEKYFYQQDVVCATLYILSVLFGTEQKITISNQHGNSFCLLCL